MVEFFIQYISTNELGLISFAHDVSCELFGSMHDISVELAMDASRAVVCILILENRLFKGCSQNWRIGAIK